MNTRTGDQPPRDRRHDRPVIRRSAPRPTLSPVAPDSDSTEVFPTDLSCALPGALVRTLAIAERAGDSNF